mgnify:CR=1 FL=1
MYKFFFNNKYDDLIKEAHEEKIIDDNNLDIIQNNYKNKEKDDSER